MATLAFDLDGTLIDSAPDLHLAINLTLKDAGVLPLSLREVTAFIGNGIPHLVRLAMAARGVDIARHAALVRAMAAHYDAVNGQLTVLYPSVTAVLETLKADGHRLVLCTNKPTAPARDILVHFGLTPVFDQIVAGDTLAVRKPNPAMLLACLPEAGGLYIGDSEVDAETARRAGVAFALFSQGYRKTPVDAMPHRFVFDAFPALVGIVADFVGDPG
jgi:phosphoglycolate phosphatase